MAPVADMSQQPPSRATGRLAAAGFLGLGGATGGATAQAKMEAQVPASVREAVDAIESRLETSMESEEHLSASGLSASTAAAANAAKALEHEAERAAERAEAEAAEASAASGKAAPSPKAAAEVEGVATSAATPPAPARMPVATGVPLGSAPKTAPQLRPLIRTVRPAGNPPGGGSSFTLPSPARVSVGSNHSLKVASPNMGAAVRRTPSLVMENRTVFNREFSFPISDQTPSLVMGKRNVFNISQEMFARLSRGQSLTQEELASFTFPVGLGAPASPATSYVQMVQPAGAASQAPKAMRRQAKKNVGKGCC